MGWSDRDILLQVTLRVCSVREMLGHVLLGVTLRNMLCVGFYIQGQILLEVRFRRKVQVAGRTMQMVF